MIDRKPDPADLITLRCELGLGGRCNCSCVEFGDDVWFVEFEEHA